MDKLDQILAGEKSLSKKSRFQVPVQPHIWEAAVGTRVARRAQPWKLARGTLVVRVSSATWANELSLLAPEILEQLQQRGVEARNLRFSVGKLAREAHVPRLPPRRPPPAKPLPQDLATQIGGIEDTELRHALAKAAARALAFKAVGEKDD